MYMKKIEMKKSMLGGLFSWLSNSWVGRVFKKFQSFLSKRSPWLDCGLGRKSFLYCSYLASFNTFAACIFECRTKPTKPMRPKRRPQRQYKWLAAIRTSDSRGWTLRKTGTIVLGWLSNPLCHCTDPTDSAWSVDSFELEPNHNKFVKKSLFLWDHSSTAESQDRFPRRKSVFYSMPHIHTALRQKMAKKKNQF